jgi:ferredoxin-NADP reductase
LNPETVGIRLSCPDIASYKAGQYLKVFVDEHTVRCYSLASTPGLDEELHLHVRRGASGSASRWFHETLEVGASIRVGHPQGRCCYLPDNIDQPILMIGTGSGLAPLYGMARDALRQGHRGEIRLYHGVRYREELYLVEQLQMLSRSNRNFLYAPCISRGEDTAGCLPGRALDIAMRDTPLSRAWCVYLSGNPQMVGDAFEAALAAGVAADAILSDQLPVHAAAVACAA